MLLANAALSSRSMWYLTRGTGLVSLGLLTVSVVLGIAQVARYAPEGWPRFVVLSLHRNASLLAVAFLAVHIATAVVDGFAPIAWVDALVPFHSGYRPLWLGLGALAVDLLLALVLSSLVREHLGYRAWRMVHWCAYACWPLAFAHGVGTGSDIQVSWVQGFDLACLIAVVGAVGWRLASRPAPLAAAAPVAIRAVAAGATVVTALGLVAFAALGPLQPGWARRAGTPPQLLGGSSNAAAAAPADAGVQTGLQLPFTADLAGTITEQDSADGGAVVTIDAALSGGATGAIHVVLEGRALAGGGVSLARSTATMGPSSQPGAYQGSVAGLDGRLVQLALRDSAGRVVGVELDLNLDGPAGTVSGRAVATVTGAVG